MKQLDYDVKLYLKLECWVGLRQFFTDDKKKVAANSDEIRKLGA